MTKPRTPHPDAPTPNARGPLPGGVWNVPVEDAAEYLLPFSVRTLRTLISADDIPHRRHGGRVWMAWPEDFDTFMETARRGPK